MGPAGFEPATNGPMKSAVSPLQSSSMAGVSGGNSVSEERSDEAAWALQDLNLQPTDYESAALTRLS